MTCTGTVASYHRGCRCPECRAAAAAANRRYRRLNPVPTKTERRYLEHFECETCGEIFLHMGNHRAACAAASRSTGTKEKGELLCKKLPQSRAT